MARSLTWRCCPWCLTEDEKAAARIDQEINRILLEQKKRDRAELKLLLLGTGESGKSTFIKQMRIIHGAGYSEEERKGFRPLVYQNIFVSMRAMIEAMDRLQIPFSRPESSHYASLVMSQDPYKVTTFEKRYAVAMQWLWRDAGIRACYERRREFHLLDSAVYYLSHLERITEENYTPTAQDVLRSRMPTTGINEYCFSVQKTNLRIVDVGGQKSERKKWIHCFENVIALIYLASLSEYDQCLEENNQEARSRTRRQPRGSSWTCTRACTPAAWTVLTGAGGVHAPGAYSATTRAPRTPRTSARSSRTCGTRCWPATWTRSTCCDPGPAAPGLRPVRGRWDLRADRCSVSPDAPCRSAPGPGGGRAVSESGVEGGSAPPPFSAPHQDSPCVCPPLTPFTSSEMEHKGHLG
uniref:G protein subunit alpha 15 n=1 Tax=Ailuropoda melanoleuca TaxID=9646 RepID=A0A7N5JIL1_AILME